MIAFEDLTTVDRKIDGRPPVTTDRRVSDARIVDGTGPPPAARPLEQLRLPGAVTRSTRLDGVVFVHQRLREASLGVPPAALLQHFTAETGEWDPTGSHRTSEGRELILIEHVDAAAEADTEASDTQRLARESLDFIEELGLAEMDLLGFSLGVRPPEDVVLLSPRLVRRLVAASRRARRRPRVGPSEAHDGGREVTS